MITVLHLRASNFVGGPEKQIIKHGQCLDKDSFTFILCPFRNGEEGEELEAAARAQGLNVIPLRVPGSYSPTAVSRLAEILKKNKVDILCTHGYKPNVVGQLAARCTGAKVIAFSRGWTYENTKVRFYEAIDRLFLGFADHTVAVSEGHKREILKAGISGDSVSVIHNAIDLSDSGTVPRPGLRNLDHIDPGDQIVVSAGRLSPEKNFGGLIETAKTIKENIPRAKFVVFGEGILRESLEKKIEEYGLKRVFLLPGFRAEFASLLHQADVFVLPSLTEGLPNVILEAYAAKLPVVATNVGGNPEVVIDGKTGFIIPPGEAAAIAEKVNYLLKNVGMAKEMGKAGYARVRDEFNFEKQTSKLQNIYLRVLNKNS